MVSDYKNLITNHMGPPEDFDSFVMSFLLKGPEKWDVLFLDKGERGVRAANLKSPYMQFKNPSWVGAVHVQAASSSQIALNRSTYQVKPFYQSSEIVLPIK
jgi:hypothetical protein